MTDGVKPLQDCPFGSERAHCWHEQHIIRRVSHAAGIYQLRCCHCGMVMTQNLNVPQLTHGPFNG